MIEEYMEDFLWLSQQLQNGARLLKEGQVEGLPSPDPIRLEITGANIDENGNYILVITCSTKPLSIFFGFVPQTEEDWARNKAWEYGGLSESIKTYKGIKVRIKFRTAKGDIEDQFIKPPNGIVKRTIVLPAPYNYVEVVTYTVWEAEKEKIEREREKQMAITIALIGTIIVPYTPEIAGIAAKLMGFSPATLDYWFAVQELADALNRVGLGMIAGSLLNIAREQIEKILGIAKAQPITATQPQTATAKETAPEKEAQKEETTYTPQPHPPSTKELEKKYIPI